MNVFSIVDNFKYFDEDDKKKFVRGDDGVFLLKLLEGYYFDFVMVDYYFVGWYFIDSIDFLFDKNGKFIYEDKFKVIYMELKDIGMSEVEIFFIDIFVVRMCFYGVLYDVCWDMNIKFEMFFDKFLVIF